MSETTDTVTDAVLDVRDLRVAFGPIEPVRGVSFSLRRGERLGLVGESGSGKSLTALAIMRLARRAQLSGQVLLEGEDLLTLKPRQMEKVRGGRVAMVYQDPMSALNPVQTVGHQLEEAIRLHSRLDRRGARERAIELLDGVGVPHPQRRVEQYPHEFSGGMRQRVMIAMAMCADPAVLICDEPTTALDVTTQARIMDLLDRLVEDHGTAVMLITHDLGVAAGFCDSIQVMYGGRIVERAEAEALYRAPVHPYSEALLGAAVDLSLELGVPIPTIGGQPPLAGRLPSGCSFHPRCPHAQDVCRTDSPALESAAGRPVACHFADARAQTLEESDVRV
ncbi:ABC transporter ATP-binding protein [Conexibacter woesei]|uniref:Oligopeptide/dipeptide ABC transporter, ATPase subunit n=1 Tax=Conexibacter woesei (strain DSM 14684 / CCUG 47730 / CIP 108061 / JCM 11494 / NBRC 100937 / ID131577) TaxID=469383 RepID=D3F4X3_CONWI|nr:ABC transporter ATP-binding protein [Conexibacter woesei]ADB48551.1 oligopeptide/dipeptide ABC transporter, ATPase subunit [Conexibacter woesei DSM 14684]